MRQLLVRYLESREDLALLRVKDIIRVNTNESADYGVVAKREGNTVAILQPINPDDPNADDTLWLHNFTITDEGVTVNELFEGELYLPDTIKPTEIRREQTATYHTLASILEEIQ